MVKPVLYRAAYLGFMFAANLVLANLLAPTGFGQLSLMVLNASLLSLISGLGSDSMALHAMAQHKWTYNFGVSFLATTALSQVIIFTIIETLSWLLFNRTVLALGGIQRLPIEILFFVGLVLTEKCLVAYYALDRSKLYNLILLGFGIFYIIVLLTFWLGDNSIGENYLFWLVALQSTGQGLALMIGLFFVQKNFQWTKINWPKTFGILRSASLIMVTNVVQLLAYRIDYWLLRHFHSNLDVGLFAQANKFAGLLWLLPNILAALLIPKFSQAQPEEIPVVFRAANLLNLLIAVITAIITTFIYDLFLLPEYKAGIQAFWLMLPGYFCWALVIFFGAYFSWAGEFKANLLASTLCLIIIGIADAVLIPKYGINGAAVANSIAYTLVLLLYFYLFARRTGTKPAMLVTFFREDFSTIKRTWL